MKITKKKAAEYIWQSKNPPVSAHPNATYIYV